jgi:hypothetical protein
MSKAESDRLRALRDRIGIRGRYELSVEEKIACIGEIISTFTFRAFDLIHPRRYIAKLESRHPDLNDGQKVLLAKLKDRYEKRAQWIKERAEKKRLGEPISPRKQQESEVPATPEVNVMERWRAMLKETNGGNHNPGTTINPSES